MGILCEACQKLHFAATSPGIQLSRRYKGIYRLAGILTRNVSVTSLIAMFQKQSISVRHHYS